MQQYKPAAYSTVSPYLIVNGADATIEFLKQVFDAVELRRFPDDAGKLMHAEVRIDDTVLMLADPVPPQRCHPFFARLQVANPALDRTGGGVAPLD